VIFSNYEIVNKIKFSKLILVSSVYVSTNFALEGLSESFAYELEPYGIRVVHIEQGVINTNFVEDIMIPDNTHRISSHLMRRSPLTASATVTYSGSPQSNGEMTEYANVIEWFVLLLSSHEKCTISKRSC
jgi:NAD(P)-dependent dehydrogenase (short-subunit alcohol dehydrogenase family)